jgi:hypothetical protein
MKSYSIHYTNGIITSIKKISVCRKSSMLKYVKILSLPKVSFDEFGLLISMTENRKKPFLQISMYSSESKFKFWSHNNDKKENYLYDNTVKFDFYTRSILIINHRFLYTNCNYKYPINKEINGDVLIQFNKKGWKHFLGYLMDFYSGKTEDNYYKKIMYTDSLGFILKDIKK